MRPTDPLPLHHSWPLFESGVRFALGMVSPEPAAGMPLPAASAVRGDGAIGHWACDLATGALSWSAAVHDIFGLPRDARPSREETVACYREESRATLERLRAYGIRHRRGFTLDAEIRAPGGQWRWMRVTAAPVCVDGRVVALHGLKRALFDE